MFPLHLVLAKLFRYLLRVRHLKVKQLKELVQMLKLYQLY